MKASILQKPGRIKMKKQLQIRYMHYFKRMRLSDEMLPVWLPQLFPSLMPPKHKRYIQSGIRKRLIFNQTICF